MANRKRSIVLRVPVTAEERALIEKKMQQMGTRCFSVYARKMLIDVDVWVIWQRSRCFFPPEILP